MTFVHGQHHCGDGGGGGEIGAALPEELHDFGARLAGPVDEGRQRGGVEAVGDRLRTDVRLAQGNDHLVPVASEGDGPDGVGTLSGGQSGEGAEAGRVEDPGHAHDPRGGEAGGLLGQMGHLVERVRDHDHDGVGGVPADALGHIPDDGGVDDGEVRAAHPRLAGPACGHHDEVGIGRLGQVGRPPQAGGEAVAGRNCARGPGRGRPPSRGRRRRGRSRRTRPPRPGGGRSSHRRARRPPPWHARSGSAVAGAHASGPRTSSTRTRGVTTGAPRRYKAPDGGESVGAGLS